MASRPHDVPDIPYNTGSRFSPETLEALLEISGALTSSLDLDVVLRTAIEHTCGLLGLDTGAIYVLDDGSLYLGATTPPCPPNSPRSSATQF